MLTKEIFLTFQSIFIIANGAVGQSQVAVGSTHAHPVFQVPCQGQVLIIVSDSFLVVSQAVVSITQEMTSFSLTLDIIQLLAEHQIVFVERYGLAELASRRVTVAEVAQGTGLADTVL